MDYYNSVVCFILCGGCLFASDGCCFCLYVWSGCCGGLLFWGVWCLIGCFFRLVCDCLFACIWVVLILVVLWVYCLVVCLFWIFGILVV